MANHGDESTEVQPPKSFHCPFDFARKKECMLGANGGGGCGIPLQLHHSHFEQWVCLFGLVMSWEERGKWQGRVVSLRFHTSACAFSCSMIKEDNVVIGINYFLVVDLASRPPTSRSQLSSGSQHCARIQSSNGGDDSVQEKTVLGYGIDRWEFSWACSLFLFSSFLWVWKFACTPPSKIEKEDSVKALGKDIQRSIQKQNLMFHFRLLGALLSWSMTTRAWW